MLSPVDAGVRVGIMRGGISDTDGQTIEEPLVQRDLSQNSGEYLA